ncbi:MAG: thymidine kinase [Gemmatimonadota bacterium]|jgi:thymidine kinase|nr:thymidine kinase [Gemmatimonadota bacterium]MDP6529556.1 thymidine kinase [Gemmatimonadota bacterium]MDP6803544.1 thymidine kinase [Gemmatimonadota bacterium]MDP7031920.1 thymidine kinase [Gemmatimonadota bacterium]
MSSVVGEVGWVEVICGGMFSGKTEELIRRLVRARIARQKVQVFKPRIDRRYAADQVVSHSGQRIPSTEVEDGASILQLVLPETKAVGIDEAQFFGMDLVDVVNRLSAEGRRVIVAGLDQDYRGEPFEPVPQLMAIAESVTKTTAVCVVCGHPATRTQRNITESDRVLVGAGDAYEARCRSCWSPDVLPPAPREDAEDPAHEEGVTAP